MGADAVIIARPFVTAVYGGEEEGVKCYIEKIKAELSDTMAMCGAHSIAEITSDMVRKFSGKWHEDPGTRIWYIQDGWQQ